MILFDCGYSTDVDGAGTRLVFYLKGCNFRCDWCGAPESISPRPQVLRYPGRTVSVGESVPPARIVSKALRARAFVDGVTFGGGEPTLQADELVAILRELKAAGIHTALESNASTSRYREVIPWVDQLFSDLKTLSPESFASRINPDVAYLERVKANLRYAAMTHPDLTIRIPVVSGLNDGEDAQRKIARFLAGVREEGGRFQVQLLRQHHLAEPKYQALNQVYPCRDVPVPERRVLSHFSDLLKKFHIKVCGDENSGN